MAALAAAAIKPSVAEDGPAEWGLHSLETLVTAIPVELHKIRAYIAKGGRDVGDTGYALTEKIQGLLTRLHYDAQARLGQAMAAAEDMSPRDQVRARSLRRRVEAVRGGLDAYAKTLAEILEKGRREETHRVARGQRLLGYAVAGLAGLTAIPLLVGQMSPQDLTATLATLPKPFSGLASVVEALRPWLAALGVLGSFALAMLLAILLVRAGLPSRERGTDPVAVAGRALPILRTASRGDERDATATQALLEVIAELEGTDRRGKLDADESVDAFIVRAELACRRPVPMPGPRSAALVRYCLDPANVGGWLGNPEFAACLPVGRTVAECDRRAATAPAASPTESLRALGL